MKIYAVRDRMLNYYMQPFAGPGDKEVLAAISAQVNNGDAVGIAAAPHHYEIWRLADISEEGHVQESREFIADCSSLIRAGHKKAPVATEPKREEKDT